MLKRHSLIIILIFIILMNYSNFAQEPYRVGTTTASFLEIGVGSAGIAMGDAYVASANDLSAIYWNPAGLALLETNEVLFMYQPWVVDVNSIFTGFGLPLEGIGTIAIGIFGLDYGDIDVTTLEYQQGTGEKYTATDYCISLTYARSIVDWFSFGASVKYISSKIWHTNADAIAIDLGVMIQTPFFSSKGNRENGLRIGMSIANYGTKMRYDGDDLLFPIDIDESVHGNYQNLQGKYNMAEWELPLLFRVGVAVTPIVFANHKLTIEVDALHPNNMSEFVNIGTEYKFFAPGFGDFSLRAGYKGIFLVDSNFGLTLGAGLNFHLSRNLSVNTDFGYHTIGVLGDILSISFGFHF